MKWEWLLILVASALLPMAVQAANLTEAQKNFTESKVAKQWACTTCHAVGGTGGTVGPKLDQAGNRRSEAWLRRWLKDPPAVRPGTLMPNFFLSDKDIDTLVGLLTNLRVDIDTDGIMSGSGNEVDTGHELFKAYDCLACHRLGQEGRFIGPDLTWFAKRRTPAWETAWLTNPDKVKPGTFMPNFNLPPEQIKVLVAYLMTLNGQENAEAQEWEMNTAFQLNSRPREVGQKIYKRLGCNGCHGVEGKNDINGRDGFTNPNAAPDGMMPAVNDAAQKFTAAGFADLLMTARTPGKVDASGSDPLPCPSWQGTLDDEEMAALYAYFKNLLPKDK